MVQMGRKKKEKRDDAWDQSGGKKEEKVAIEGDPSHCPAEAEGYEINELEEKKGMCTIVLPKGERRL